MQVKKSTKDPICKYILLDKVLDLRLGHRRFKTLALVLKRHIICRPMEIIANGWIQYTDVFCT